MWGVISRLPIPPICVSIFCAIKLKKIFYESLILCFPLVTVSKLCPSPHVHLDCFPSWGDFIEKIEAVTFAFLWLCVTAATCACPHPCSLSLLCEVVSFVVGKTHSSTSAVVPLLFPLGFCLAGLSLFCVSSFPLSTGFCFCSLQTIQNG